MGASQVDIKPVIPAPTSILSGNAKAANSAVAVTLLTIPAGRTWYGTITIAANNTTATAADATAIVSTSGTGVTPAAGTNLLTAGDTGATGTGNNAYSGAIYVAAGTAAAVLQLTNSTATTFSSYASANGILL